jgi:putative intracellular protease/amidase
MTATTPRKTLRIGVFIPTECQLLDMACVDILGTMSHEYLTWVKEFAPGPIVDLAPSIRISCMCDPFHSCIPLHVADPFLCKDISRLQPGELIPVTSSARVPCTHHFSDPEVQPGQLDIVIVPGPDPLTNWDEIKDATDWLAAHAARPETDILSICTGIYLCGAAGLLKGKKACGPRGLQDHLAKKFEGVQWVGEELRWVRDGNLWSSGESRFTQPFSCSKCFSFPRTTLS